MSPTVEYGSKDAADAAREKWDEYLCPDDDRRLKTVRFVGDVPDRVLERAELEAAESLGERESGPGQAELTDHEKDRIDFSKGRANVPWAQSIKAIARDEGVDDWTAHVDPTLSVDEHREEMDRAAREGGGQRMDAEETARETAGRYSRQAQSDECDHYRGGCENGHPEACEFLQQRCNYDADEVAEILADHSQDVDETEQQTLTGKQAGAYHRSLSGYRSAIAALRELIDAVREERRNAEQAWSAMVAIRRDTGQDVEDPEQLHELLDSLADIPDGHRLSTLHEHMAQEDVDESDESSSWSVEKQGTLGSGVEADEVAEEKQVTLAGEDSDSSVGAVPSAWRRQGSTWQGGPFSVQMDKPGQKWVVRLLGPNGREEIARVKDVTQAEEIAEGFVDRVTPDEISMHSNDGTVPEAAAAAKAEATPDSGGLSAYK